MKRIINGKMYNTETAKKLGNYTYGDSGDFYRVRETLYQKKNGEFFLCGEGGALSSYGECVGTNELTNGEELTPFTEEEAKDWMEIHGSVDAYCEVFGEPEE